jgi:hypothetical protein
MLYGGTTQRRRYGSRELDRTLIADFLLANFAPREVEDMTTKHTLLSTRSKVLREAL